MTKTEPTRRAIVLAPIGRDAAVICAILSNDGFDCETVPSVAELVARLDCTDVAVIAEEAFTRAVELEALGEWLGKQPPWSDLPFVLLSIPDRAHSDQRQHVHDTLGNFTLLERPLRPDTLSRAVNAAARARRRQLETARLLDERTRAEAERRVREERLRELFENAADAIFITDADGLVSDVNPAGCALLRATREDLMGRDFSELVVETERGDFRSWLLLQTDGIASAGEWRMLVQERASPRDAQCVDVEISARVLSDGRWQAFARDISDRKLAEVALREWNETLEARVAERTAELVRTQAALAQAQKMEAVGQLTGGVAHDFNNLLMVISGGLEMIGSTDSDARRKRIMDGMRQAVERGATLTRQLLTFSRRGTLAPEVIALDRRVSKMSEILERSLRGDILVDMQFEPRLWPINVDPTQLELAVLNLAVNARDAMPDGGRLVLRGANAPNVDDGELKGDFVRLSVADSGTGMAPDVMSRVFEPFFTTKGVGKGSGLGLAQIYGFAKESGGSVRVESTPGHGTTFTLYLPRSYAELPDAELETVDGLALASANVPAPSGGNILLVEDDDEVAALVANMIEQLGYDVTRVATGAAALGAMANDRDIDLVFSDIMMPGDMSGADLAREIRRRRPGLPIVLTTGYDGQARAAAGDIGLPILRKPYRLDALASTLASAMQARSSQSGALPPS